MGIPTNATVGEVLNMRRRNRHRRRLYDDIETELAIVRQNRVTSEEDMVLWKSKEDSFRQRFVSKDTWNLIRRVRPRVNWYKGVWFSHATPKYSFLVWLAFKNRLATGDRIKNWNVNANSTCVFCSDPMETRDHLFFLCPFTGKIWENLAKGLLKDQFVSEWEEIHDILTKPL
ncbi:uncharacterized protein LOC112086811 [Eutrema salsugineum]|uniref:uncharacterized protein LOC112086811 n=1 Tax=Eutrema salsugineum TaxID=72664 RepID=UPI000CED64C4|nr:uncharacterized protein LOC112086811 [Eutrema salsugineum]